MQDIEKELGLLIDNYIKKYEESKAKKQEQLEENQDYKNTFNQLVQKVIRPEMNKYCQLLEKKGFLTSILHESGHQAGVSLSYKKSTHSEFMPPLIPSLRFVVEKRKISIYENKFDPSGLACSCKEGTYETYQITKSFVNEKLSIFFKALFSVQ